MDAKEMPAELGEGFQLMARELRSLNESLNALAYAALGRSPRVRRRQVTVCYLATRSSAAA